MTRKEPIYFQIMNDLVRDIKAGIYALGDTIPTEPELRERYQASRGTVRRALLELQILGYLNRSSGKKTTVASTRESSVLKGFPKGTLTSFSDQVRASGASPSSQVRDAVVLPSSATESFVREAYAVALPDRFVKIRRLRFADDVPLALQTVYLPEPRFLGLLDCFAEGAELYQILRERYNAVPASARELLRITRPDDESIRLLDLEAGDLVVARTRVTYDINNQPIELLSSIEVPYYFGYQYEVIAESTALKLLSTTRIESCLRKLADDSTIVLSEEEMRIHLTIVRDHLLNYLEGRSYGQQIRFRPASKVTEITKLVIRGWSNGTEQRALCEQVNQDPEFQGVLTESQLSLIYAFPELLIARYWHSSKMIEAFINHDVTSREWRQFEAHIQSIAQRHYARGLELVGIDVVDFVNKASAEIARQIQEYNYRADFAVWVRQKIQKLFYGYVRAWSQGKQPKPTQSRCEGLADSGLDLTALSAEAIAELTALFTKARQHLRIAEANPQATKLRKEVIAQFDQGVTCRQISADLQIPLRALEGCNAHEE